WGGDGGGTGGVGVGRELREAAQALLASPRVVPVLPVRAEVAQPLERHALAPVGDGRGLGPAGGGEAAAEVVELGLGDLDAEGGHGVGHGRTLGTGPPGALGEDAPAGGGGGDA